MLQPRAIPAKSAADSEKRAVGRTLRLLASKIRRTGKEHEAEKLVREAGRAQTSKRPGDGGEGQR